MREATVPAPERGARPQAAGGEEALHVHAGEVALLCRRLLGPGQAAEEAAEAALARARRALGGYHPREPFRRWLLAIATHHAIGILLERCPGPQPFAPGAAGPDDLEAPARPPLGHALAPEAWPALEGLLDELPDPHRAALVLRHLGELDYAGIAEALGVSREDVGTLLVRARRRVRAGLARRSAR
jgi:RNA polymerase sigma-70 factor (ECF subfamily)